MQTTNDTRNSVKEKPKATMRAAKETTWIRLAMAARCPMNYSSGGRGMAKPPQQQRGSGRAIQQRQPRRRAGERAGAQGEHGRGGRAGRRAMARRRRRDASASSARAGGEAAQGELGSHRQRRARRERSSAWTARAWAGARNGVASRASRPLSRSRALAGEQVGRGVRTATLGGPNAMARDCPAVVAEGLRRWWRVGMKKWVWR
ncbi:hypothetical protein Syun_001608 [Stephania yunnanensis]|uniref:Uncharacterized protein n=1 Tax=Stephania yunnanensis TaxID=152371 RepID=A0AAP0LE52_9MAGN